MATTYTYRFFKETNGNVLLVWLRSGVSFLTHSIIPDKDLRISQSLQGRIVIPIKNSGGLTGENSQYINIPWQRIDFAGSFPVLANPTSPNDAIEKLSEHFFYENAGGSGGGVQSVTGDSVDNTDPLNPIIKSVANLSFYPTTAASDIPTYVKLVTNITDPDYDDPAVNIPTGAISGTGQLLSSLAAAPGVFIGNPGVINIETVGEIRRTSGTGLAEFYFEAYHRDSLGTETLIGTSNNTAPVSVNVYTQFQASLLLNNGVFTATDRLVLKFYGNRIAGGSNPSYDFLFGGTTPVRTLFPIPAGLISNVQSVNGFTGVVVLNASDVGALATVAVDGVTITGDGTVGNPLVSVGGGGGGLDQLQVVLNSQVYS